MPTPLLAKTDLLAYTVKMRDTAGPEIETVHCTTQQEERLQQAQETLLSLVEQTQTVNLQKTRDDCMTAVTQWMEALHAALRQGQASMLSDKVTKNADTRDGTVHLVGAWRRWQGLMKIPQGRDWAGAVKQQEHMKLALAKCSLYGPAIPSNCPIGQDKSEWIKWAKNCPGENGEGLTAILTRLAARRGATVLNTDTLITSKVRHKRASQEDQLKRMNDSRSNGGCQGLIIGVNEITGELQPTMQHELMADHIAEGLQTLGSEKGSGPNAYASTSALHRILYNVTRDRNDRSVVRPKPEKEMEENLKQVLTELEELERRLDSTDPAEAIRLQWQTSEEMLLHSLHFRPPDTCRHAFTIYEADDRGLDSAEQKFAQCMKNQTANTPNRGRNALAVVAAHLKAMPVDDEGPTTKSSSLPEIRQKSPILQQADIAIRQWHKDVVAEIQTIRLVEETGTEPAFYI